jgi:hypothetical protein
MLDCSRAYENGRAQKGKETAPRLAECVAVPAAIEQSAVIKRRNLAPFAQALERLVDRRLPMKGAAHTGGGGSRLPVLHAHAP